ncbi:toll/interleukin-1 receptor domain-containing protein [Streptomyces sp. NBC_00638]|uniref:toll/interleukin-1 receptor domain-containing protein n=1 Tax=Streptomyces sp. NBC_00638 TaxID=2975794 RepID=UPI00225A9E1F|nr:toll/interleukin-1 receptor domain-containing protein [Streptomyces sp. NBC_00638]MCX5008167.1 toll/interleukin-1 receptor domain-containing protein [Streptomyces sp. NBC_00638]
MHIFMSHNHRDKTEVTPVAARLRLLGVNVWLDSWEIRPGDSIVGKVNEALGMVDTVAVFWSAHAAGSQWVNTEWETALTRRLSDRSVRVIPIKLDDTDLPVMLQPIMYVSMKDGDADRAVRELTGASSQADLLRAMQQTVEESGLEYRYFPGYGVVVGCPRCGTPSSKLDYRQEVDHGRDVAYGEVRCSECSWRGGGELFVGELRKLTRCSTPNMDSRSVS